VKAILTPLYDTYEKHCQSGDIDKCVDFYHPDAVMFLSPTGEQRFVNVSIQKSNEKYEGGDDYLILTCDNTMESAKRGKETAKMKEQKHQCLSQKGKKLQ
ncbi:unnamed protein product, partial [Cylicostephanus goldi]